MTVGTCIYGTVRKVRRQAVSMALRCGMREDRKACSPPGAKTL